MKIIKNFSKILVSGSSIKSNIKSTKLAKNRKSLAELLQNSLNHFIKHCKFKLLSDFINHIFPQQCLSCSEIISTDSLFCLDCWQKLEFISKPHCEICSFPFEVEIKNMRPICGLCFQKKPSYDRVIAVFRYEPKIGKAISDLKYRDQLFVAKSLATFLANKASKEIENCDIMTSIPLHKNRLRKRKFNQTNLIANFLNSQKNYPELLWRVADKTPQVKLTQKQRKNNLQRAFLVNKKFRDQLKGKKILLIDDVMTTGATLNSCAKELKRRGAKEVICLVVAKTIFS